jgi:hypothetical protein
VTGWRRCQIWVIGHVPLDVIPLGQSAGRDRGVGKCPELKASFVSLFKSMHLAVVYHPTMLVLSGQLSDSPILFWIVGFSPRRNFSMMATGSVKPECYQISEFIDVLADRVDTLVKPI